MSFFIQPPLSRNIAFISDRIHCVRAYGPYSAALEEEGPVSYSGSGRSSGAFGVRSFGPSESPVKALDALLELYPHPALAFVPAPEKDAGRILGANPLFRKSFAAFRGSSSHLQDYLLKEDTAALVALSPHSEWRKSDVTLNASNGSRRCFDLHGSVRILPGIDDLPLGLLFFMDTTDRCGLIEKLKEGEDLRCILESTTTDVVSRMTPEGIVTYISPAGEVLTGFKDEEVVGRSGYEFIHPEDLERIQRDHATILTESVLHVFEHRTLCKNGSWRWFETRARAVRDPQNGAITEIHSSQRDISDRKRSEEESEGLLRTLSASADYVCLVGFDGRLSFGNDALRRLRGWGSQEDLSQVLLETLQPSWAADFIKNVAMPTAVTDGLWVGESAVLDGNGNEIRVSLMISAPKKTVLQITFPSSCIGWIPPPSSKRR